MAALILLAAGAALYLSGAIPQLGSERDSAASNQADVDPLSGPAEPLTIITSAGPKKLMVEVARTTEQQMMGLMFRKSLADDRGMLFPHEFRETSMWMRNTFISLDMVFILPGGTVHRIEAMSQPMSERVISSGGPVTAVLEIAGGNAARLGLKPGDKIKHPFFDH